MCPQNSEYWLYLCSVTCCGVLLFGCVDNLNKYTQLGFSFTSSRSLTKSGNSLYFNYIKQV